jgi:hypothetical protein
LTSSLFSHYAFATLITVNYAVNFTSHTSSEDYDWVGNIPNGFDSTHVINQYLQGNHFISVQYDTNRIATRTLLDTSTVISTGGHYAKTVESNIDLSQSDSNYFYNYVDQITINRGQDIAVLTNIDNLFSFEFIQDSIFDLSVGDISSKASLYNEQFGEFQFKNSSGTIIDEVTARDVYSAVLTVTSISVPEPSTIAIFAFGMLGLVSRRFKGNK